MDLKECCSQQLAELEMLQSMFENEREFFLEDAAAFSNVVRCANGEIDPSALITSVSFRVKLKVDPKASDTLELECHLPPSYPDARPSFILRSSGLTNAALKKATSDLHAFLDSEVPAGDLCVTSLIAWLQEHGENIYAKDFTGNAGDERPSRTQQSDTAAFNRLWIYSHHIYSQKKRKMILESAKQLNLSGFCMPGKPGVICVEGDAAAAEAFWREVRRWTWQRICLRGEERTELTEGQGVEAHRRFRGFEEKFFKAEHAANNDRHMDLGGLLEFLTAAGLPHVFQLYFGVEGRPPT